MQKTHDGMEKHTHVTDQQWVPHDAIFKSFYVHRELSSKDIL